MERKRKVQKAAISGAGFILMLILCIICIKEVLGAAVNEAEKGIEGGTYNKKLRTAISGYYDYYKVNLDGNYDSSFLRSTVQKSINNKVKPVIGHFHAPNGEGHDMCINGYYDITVCYKKTRKSTTYSSVTYRYYRVNNGWFYAPSSDSSMTDERLQYIREEYLTGITKIV